MAMTEERMERVKAENCFISFNSAEEMEDFLRKMENSDSRIEVSVASVKTRARAENNGNVLYLSTEAGDFPCFNLAMSSLEQRSGDTAIGHSMMSLAQVADSMNNYWGLHNPKEKMNIHLRGGKVLQAESERYAPMSQAALFRRVADKVQELYPNAARFVWGDYTHQMTAAKFAANGELPQFFQKSWLKAGLPQEELKGATIYFTFSTADLANAAAKVVIEMKSGENRIFMGDEISVVHKDSGDPLSTFQKKLDGLSETVEDELQKLCRLMEVEIKHPYEACEAALAKAKVPQMAKKAAKELLDILSWEFFGPENAFTLYSSLFGILRTEQGMRLSDQKKLMISNSLHKLVSEDWAKFDRPAI